MLMSDLDSDSESTFRFRSGIRFQIRIWNLLPDPDLENNVGSEFWCWCLIRIQKLFSGPDPDLKFVSRSGFEICWQIQIWNLMWDLDMDVDVESGFGFRNRFQIQIQIQIQTWNLFSDPDLKFIVICRSGICYQIRTRNSLSDPDLKFVLRSRI